MPRRSADVIKILKLRLGNRDTYIGSNKFIFAQTISTKCVLWLFSLTKRILCCFRILLSHEVPPISVFFGHSINMMFCNCAETVAQMIERQLLIPTKFSDLGNAILKKANQIECINFLSINFTMVMWCCTITSELWLYLYLIFTWLFWSEIYCIWWRLRDVDCVWTEDNACDKIHC